MSLPTPQDFEKAKHCPHGSDISEDKCYKCEHWNLSVRFQEKVSIIERLESEKSLLEKRVRELTDRNDEGQRQYDKVENRCVELEAENERLKAEVERLQGGYCNCSTVSNYKLFVEGNNLRHGDCSKILSPKDRASFNPLTNSKALEIARARDKVIDGVRKQDHKGCSCDVCESLESLDALTKEEGKV